MSCQGSQFMYSSLYTHLLVANPGTFEAIAL